ncbi:inner membrane transporter yfaV [Xylariaceae sp. FL1272]|nr:inner membrane transporter yfaV [Xylariaceae sp. FL1272]
MAMVETGEKSADGIKSPVVQSRSSLSMQGWTRDEELRARKKVDSSVLPLLYLGLLVFQLDRMNLASALTGGFAKDIGITQTTINLGNQLMFLGIVVLEIPSNMLLQRLGPRKWISAQVFLFGLVATLQIFVRNRQGFLAVRMILGLCEAGYIPGAAYTLSTWYTKRELAKRVAIFFFGMFGGNALSPLLASGILKLEGARGIKGWQWLFLLEGVFTMAVSVLLFCLLPGSPDTPKPLGTPGIIKFSASEQEILQKRLNADDEERRGGAQGMHIPLKLVWKTVSHYRRWPHFVSTFAVFSTWSPLTTYTPTIIMSLGFDRIQANALAAVGASLALLVVFFFAFLSDRTNQRGLPVVLAHACYLVTLIVARSVHPHVGKWSRWGLWTAINSFAVGYHPVHNSWVQLNCNDPRERSISIAMWVMSAITGLMVGTQYFQGNDGPFYNNGLRIMIIMVAVGMVFALLQIGIYRVHNRRVAQGRYKASPDAEPRIYVP